MKVATCYIFVKYCNEEGCLTVCFDVDGQNNALRHQPYSEIQQICLDALCIVVIPSEKISLHYLELPWLPEKKARLAIPYAMEEKLAEPIEKLHFSFDKRYYENGKYLIAVCDKEYFTAAISQLREKNIPVERITADWFALNTHEVLFIEERALIHNTDFLGTLLKELIPFYPLKSETQQIYSFDPKFNDLATHQFPKEQFPLFIARRLESRPLFNLSQGSFQQITQKLTTKRLFQIAAALFTLWIISIISVNVLTLHNLNQEIAQADKAIAKVYKQFFPKAKQVISPRFRIEQALKSQKDNNNPLWELLNTLAIVLKNNPSSVESIKYQNNRVQVTLVSKNFDALEALQLALQKERVTVKQNQASTRENQVVSILELTL